MLEFQQGVVSVDKISMRKGSVAVSGAGVRREVA